MRGNFADGERTGRGMINEAMRLYSMSPMVSKRCQEIDVQRCSPLMNQEECELDEYKVIE